MVVYIVKLLNFIVIQHIISKKIASLIKDYYNIICIIYLWLLWLIQKLSSCAVFLVRGRKINGDGW